MTYHLLVLQNGLGGDAGDFEPFARVVKEIFHADGPAGEVEVKQVSSLPCTINDQQNTLDVVASKHNYGLATRDGLRAMATRLFAQVGSTFVTLAF